MPRHTSPDPLARLRGGCTPAAASRRHALQSLATTALALCALAGTGSAMAQSFPDKPLKLTVGFPPGTGPDVVARLLSQRLGELLKQQVVVDNKTGAGGQIAAQAVAKSPADGYNILLAEVGSISIAPAAFSKLPYDPAKEFAAVSEVVRADFVLLVPATSPHKSLGELIAAYKGKPERLNFATFGAGTPGHFGAEELAEMAGFKIEPIHYRSTGDAVTAIAAGDVQAAWVSTALALAQAKGGKVRALVTTAKARSTLMPEVPTTAEAGWPKLDFAAWFAVLAPTGTPAAVLDTLNRQVMAAMQTPEVRQKLVEAGFTVLGTPRADTERMLKTEAQRWAAIVKSTGFKGD